MLSLKQSLLLADLHPVAAGLMAGLMAVGLTGLAPLPFPDSVGEAWLLFLAVAGGTGIGQGGRLLSRR